MSNLQSLFLSPPIFNVHLPYDMTGFSSSPATE